MMIHRENLSAALLTAIRERRKVEAEMGYTGDSALVAGWVEVLGHLLEDSPQELAFFPD